MPYFSVLRLGPKSSIGGVVISRYYINFKSFIHFWLFAYFSSNLSLKKDVMPVNIASEFNLLDSVFKREWTCKNIWAMQLN